MASSPRGGALEPHSGAVVLEIASAREWVDFVERYPKRAPPPVQADWERASADYDGVHLTLSAIVATQGFSFHTDLGPTSPQYWDVETTRWLSWTFAAPSLIETVSQLPAGA